MKKNIYFHENNSVLMLFHERIQLLSILNTRILTYFKDISYRLYIEIGDTIST